MKTIVSGALFVQAADRYGVFEKEQNAQYNRNGSSINCLCKVMASWSAGHDCRLH
jgi:hypothetical protein